MPDSIKRKSEPRKGIQKRGHMPMPECHEGGNRQPFIIVEVKDEETDSDKLRMDGKAKGD